MRRFAALLLPLVLLVSCGGTGGSSAFACTQQYWDGNVGLCLPDGWDPVSRETLDERGLPEEVIAAFQAKASVSGQFPTVTVTRENLTVDADSPAYSAASIRAVSTLPGYTLIDARPVTVDGVSVQMHVFTAQPVSGEPERRFYQVSAVSGKTGYTFTALAPVSVTSALERDLTGILGTATFTDPAAAQE